MKQGVMHPQAASGVIEPGVDETLENAMRDPVVANALRDRNGDPLAGTGGEGDEVPVLSSASPQEMDAFASDLGQDAFRRAEEAENHLEVASQQVAAKEKQEDEKLEEIDAALGVDANNGEISSLREKVEGERAI